MRQFLRILLLSFSISAVESGILYLLITEEEKKQQNVFVTDPQVTPGDVMNSSYAYRQSRRRALLPYSSYRQFINGQQQPNVPRSDGRVYRR